MAPTLKLLNDPAGCISHHLILMKKKVKIKQFTTAKNSDKKIKKKSDSSRN